MGNGASTDVWEERFYILMCLQGSLYPYITLQLIITCQVSGNVLASTPPQIFIIPAVYYVLMNTKKESESNVRKKKSSIHPFHFEYAAVKQKRKRKTEAGGRDETG